MYYTYALYNSIEQFNLVKNNVHFSLFTDSFLFFFQIHISVLFLILSQASLILQEIYHLILSCNDTDEYERFKFLFVWGWGAG
jgi:hypothetical protein